MNILFITVLLTISCDKESDLLTEYVPFEALNKEKLDEFVVDDYFTTNPNQSVVPDGSANDTFTYVETTRNTLNSASSIEIGTSKESPQKMKPITDAYIYTVEAVIENQTASR